MELSQQNERLKCSIESSQTQIKQLQQTIEDMTTVTQNLKRKLQNVENNKETTEKQLTQQLFDKQKYITTLENEIKNSTEQIQCLQRRNNELQTEFDTITKDMLNSNETHRSIENR